MPDPTSPIEDESAPKKDAGLDETLPMAGPGSSVESDAPGSWPASAGMHVPVEEPAVWRAPRPGEMLGRYQILEEIGRGGMGVVLVAEDPRLKRRVALKVLPDFIARHEHGRLAFEREARLLAAIRHPNIATIHSLENEGDVHFFTMELVPGRTLGHRLGEGRLPLDEVVKIGRQMARALQAAHQAGVVHRDLKPANVMITPDGEVRILDFGVAAVCGENADALGSRDSGEISGTPGYMSPEQVRGEPTDLGTDVWAYGCVMYECVCGQRAIPGETASICARRTLEGVDLSKLPTELPASVRELIEACLRPDLEDRLESLGKARQLLEELETRRLLSTVGLRNGEEIPNNLPRPLTSFVGREQALDEVRVRLDESPIVTLTGTGGAGKTRLAYEVARIVLPGFRDGAWIVELASITEPDQVVRSVAATLNVREEPTAPLLDSVMEHLRDRQTLLILDNCEHLLGAASDLSADLLRACPGLRIIASSREALGIPGESVYQVPSLELPAADAKTPAELARGGAVRLFVDRARTAMRGFQLSDDNGAEVAEICRRLDGIPLALELAAARIRVIPVSEISKRLADRFKFLTGGSKNALSRHKTLRATIDWSYDQLDDAEKKLLRRLSIFVGGCTLAAAEHVCDGAGLEDWEVLDYVSNLVDKSLIEVTAHADAGGGQARYRMLESIREYTLERMVDSGEVSTYRQRHRDYFLELAQQAAERLDQPDQAQWFEVLEQEHDNLLAALQSYLDDQATATLGLQLAAALSKFWLVRGYWSEGRARISELLDAPGSEEPCLARVRCLEFAGALASSQTDYADAKRFLEEGLSIAKDLGERATVAEAMSSLGTVAQREGNSDEARSYLVDAILIRRELGDTAGAALVLNNLAVVAFGQRDWDGALKYFGESLTSLRQRDDRQAMAVAINGMASALYELGKTTEARPLYEEALAISRETGNRRTERNVLNNLGLVAKADGNYPEAQRLLEDSLVLRRQLGDRRGVARSLYNLADLAHCKSNFEHALDYCREGVAATELPLQTELLLEYLSLLARLALDTARTPHAVRVHGAIDAHCERTGATLSREAREQLHAVRESAVSELGPAAYDALLSEGGTLSLEEACRIGLKQ